MHVILAALLLWASLTGGCAGWVTPALYVNLLLWLALAAVGARSLYRARWSGLDFALWGLVTAGLLSAIANGGGAARPAVWAGYWAIYRLARSHRKLADDLPPAGLLALALYLAALPWQWENPNIVGMNMAGLALLGLPALTGVYGPLALAAVAGLLAWPLQSFGGLLGLGAGAAVYYRPPGWAWAGLPLVVLSGWGISGHSIVIRLEMWRAAWDTFISSPLWGIGPGAYRLGLYWHAHNIFATTAAEMGLTGLAAVTGLLIAVARRWRDLPAGHTALVTCLAVWSMVDEPAQFFGPGIILFMVLAQERSRYVSQSDPHQQ